MSISPQGLEHGTYSHQNIYSSGYFAENGSFEEWDYGFDFYAPQTFEAPDGRRILIGWMGIGDIPYSNPTTSLGWQHCLTLPREITASADGRLLQNPIRELQALRQNGIPFSSGDLLRARLPFEITGKADGNFRIVLDGILDADYRDGIFTLQFLDETASGGRTVRRTKLSRCEEIRMIADISSLELYLNGGEKVLATRFYPDSLEVTVSFENLEGFWYELKGYTFTEA